MRMWKRGNGMSSCCKKYGLPLYCVSCVPLHKIQENQRLEKTNVKQGQESDFGSEQLSTAEMYLILGGGGGEGRSGLKNALLVTQFNLSSKSLVEHPVNKLETNDDLPYRMAIHPGGDGFICSFPKSCRHFQWDVPDSMENQKLALKFSQKEMPQLEDVGLQLAVTFNAEGSLLATGGEDGHLRVFRWPSMELILDQAEAHKTVKDLDFSLDKKYLVSLGGSGPCRVWDLTASTAVSLPRETGEVLRFCRFSQCTDKSKVLYVISMRDGYGGIVSWNTASWMRVGSKKLFRDPVSAFSVSADGRLLALGTVEGDIAILDSANFQTRTMVKKAHLGLVTALTFCHDSRLLASISFDSSARVTMVEEKKKNGFSTWMVILVIVLAILAYFLEEQGILG